MYETDCVVVGAGVVGLAVARALARAGREVVVLEREGLIGSHTSSRNSEVIHAGIYYPQGSAKARLCVRGRDLLYAYAEARGVPHRRLGKIIVATEPAQAAALDGHRRRGGGERGRGPRAARGGAISRALEPALARRGRAPLAHDRHRRQPRADAQPTRARPRTTAPRSRSGTRLRRGARRRRRGSRSRPRAAARRSGSAARALVNAAGLFAGEVAAAIEGLAPAHRRGSSTARATISARRRGCPSAT